ncbi:hypothetical protein [Acidithiobacillus ferrivorans]|uniref:hypothetical protein n=1 Tax=Acidithiobacillus ferrivorans TaxID=160808 RepID=UPI000550C553|nr:hypothetical protein [Acidithiobacillus ferrivorans]
MTKVAPETGGDDLSPRSHRNIPIFEKGPRRMAWHRGVEATAGAMARREKGSRIFKGRETMRVGNFFKLTPRLCWGDIQIMAIPV